MKDQELLERITVNPRVMVGKPVIRGTRLTVEYILNLLVLPPTGPSPPITDLSCPPMAGEMGGRHRGREKLGGRQDEEMCSFPVAVEKA